MTVSSEVLTSASNDNSLFRSRLSPHFKDLKVAIKNNNKKLVYKCKLNGTYLEGIPSQPSLSTMVNQTRLKNITQG